MIQISQPPRHAAAATARTVMGQERVLNALRQMLRIRRFEEQAEKQTGIFRPGTQIKKIAGFLHLYIGQEAVQTGFAQHLDPTIDATVTSYRCHALAILAGEPTTALMAELFGKDTGNARGKGGSMHFFSKKSRMLGGHGIVGGQIPVGTGAAFSAKYLKTGGVSVSYLGDGAVPQGTFHESLNLAALWKLPAIYVVENNRYGMGTACSRAVSVENIAEAKAPGYGMVGLTCDGLDLYDVWATAKEAVALARSGQPVLVEAKTYRYRGHSASDAGLYRTKDEVDAYKKLDPIERIKTDLLSCGWLTAAAWDTLEEDVASEVATAVRFAEDSPEPPLNELATHVYAATPAAKG
ncbi:pyruvate dehydrogenase E1 component subunit alpha [Planctomycetota bacterium]|nr:pyruvate dehydrogenase E1 component subunit alpha [Planctomycetota bacterium]